MDNIEYKKFKYSLLLSTIFVGILWVVKIITDTSKKDLTFLGVYPRSTKGIVGIFSMPFIHADYTHLFANTVPLIVMGTGILFFYRSLSYKVFLIIWFFSGFCVWIFGRASYHIGASGIVYGLASFLLFSGIIRRDVRLAAISLIVVFLYGGMIWGILPIWPAISWEGHLFGGISGFACAVAYRNQGPKKLVYSWEIESDDDENKTIDSEEGLVDDENIAQY